MRGRAWSAGLAVVVASAAAMALARVQPQPPDPELVAAPAAPAVAAPPDGAQNRALAADEQRTAFIRGELQCALGPPALSGVDVLTPADGIPTNVLRPAADSPQGVAQQVGFPVSQLTYQERQLAADRYLFTFSADDRVVVGYTVVPAMYQPGKWIWDTYAQCDQAELPASTDQDGQWIWSDRTGKRVVSTRVSASAGDDGVGEVEIGTDRFVRDSGPFGECRLLGTYAHDALLPAWAVDTGYRHGATRLWRDGRDTVYVDGPAGIERLPRQGPCD